MFLIVLFMSFLLLCYTWCVGWKIQCSCGYEFIQAIVKVHHISKK